MGLPLPFGRYVLEERIAVGGMAEIFRARIDSEGFAKRVCIKRITPTLADQSHFISMFRDEASFAARMQHANIVQVFDFGEHEGTLYLAMEYVDGSDLRKLLERARHRSLRVRLGHALQIAIEVCRGLHYAHQLTDDRGRPLGIIHRDISPHNILVSRAGEVKVTDFGIAKASERSTHTATGVLKGKLAYCAPEQAAGETLDQRVDQFALGIVLWEALTGKRLFTGEHDASILRKVMFCEVPRPSLHRPDLPPSIEAVVMKALAGRPEDRFPDLRHMEHALGRCLYEVTQDPEDTQLAPLVLSLLGEPDSARRQTAVLEGASGIAPPKEPTLSHGHISAVFTSLKPPGPAEIVDDTILALSSAIDDDERAAPDSRTTLDRLPRQHPPRAETAVTQTLAPPLSPGIIDVRTSLPAPVASRRKVATLALLVMGTVAATMLWLAERPDQRELSSHNASSPNIAVSGAGAPSSSEAIQDAGIAEVADK
ncbi:MAG: serine/threonine protein kinase, partial [Myxococcota bacterium]